MTPLAVFFARPLEARRRAMAAAARWEVERQPDAAELLAALGLVEPVRVQSRPRVVPPHERCGRGTYTPGCPRCRAKNAAYARMWRMAGRRAVTQRLGLVLRVPMPLRADSRRRACSGQIELLEVS